VSLKCSVPMAALVMLAAVLSGCGYHAVGHSSRLPQDVKVLAVPMFVNQTQTYRIEQILTRDVVRELIGRTHYRVLTDSASAPDASLSGTVLSAQATPLTYDAQSGRISSAVVTVTMKVSLVDRSGHVLFENQNYSFRQQYQVSREVTSFFEEGTPALQRLSRDFAHTLVSDMLEAF
jgi:outer membrane lipopolysaccharide assembly protein LptE/RlpB